MPSTDTRFKTGNPGGPGRPKGTVPLSRIRREMQGLWDELDGVEMVRSLARKDPKWFVESVLSLLPRVREIDTTLTVSADIRLAVDAVMTETTRALREMRACGEMRGFQPMAELPPEVVEHERKAAALATAASAGPGGNGDGDGDGTHSRNGV